jgi:YVTN family beta-propeller protein
MAPRRLAAGAVGGTVLVAGVFAEFAGARSSTLLTWADYLVGAAFGVGGGWLMATSRRAGWISVATAASWFAATAVTGIASFPAYLGNVIGLGWRCFLLHLIVTTLADQRPIRGAFVLVLSAYSAALLAVPVDGFATAGLILMLAALSALRSTRAAADQRRLLAAVAVVAAILGTVWMLAAAEIGVANDVQLANDAAALVAAVLLTVGPARDVWLHGAISSLVVDLGPARRAAAPVSDLLAHALADPGLEVRYAVPGLGWFDDLGHHVDPPPPAPDDSAVRVTTVATPDGGNVALMHATMAISSPGLTQAAAQAAALAMASVRIGAEVREHSRAVRSSRRRLLTAGDAERRALEAQLRAGPAGRLQRVDLMLANLGDDKAEQIRDELAVALDDLARLARGLYPIALRDLRTAAALQGLAAGMAIPVRVIDNALEDLSDDQRALAYFFCSECLANISRHSHASSAGMDVSVVDGHLMMTVFDDGVGGAGTTCNATVTTSCAQMPPSVGLGDTATPTAVAIDQATDTVYAASSGPGLGSVSVINGASCNATETDGCQQVPMAATVGGIPVGVVFDATTRSVLVLNQGDNSVSVVSGTTCNAAVTSGCSQQAPQIATGVDPAALDVDAASNTVYVSNQNDNDVSVLVAGPCTLDLVAACRQVPASTPVGAGAVGAALDSATNTIYVANQDDGDLSVVNAATCSARVSSGCTTRWTTATTGDNPLGIAVNQTTDTVYVTNASPQNNPDGSAQSLDGSTMSVIDGAHCNASSTSSCNSPSTITVGQGPVSIAIDESTNTIYVTNFDDGTVSVIDGATCDAIVTTGCTANPLTVLVGGSPEGIAFDSASGTLYVADTGDNKVLVIDAKTCNARVATGCTQTPATIAVGKKPRGMAIDVATDTVYVANYGDHTVSVINGATCNATATTGCDQQPPTMTTGISPKRGVAVDQATGAVFVDSYYADDVDVFNGATCNSIVTAGCDQQPVAVPAGGQPVSVLVNPATNTVYASDNADGLLSFFAPPR